MLLEEDSLDCNSTMVVNSIVTNGMSNRKRAVEEREEEEEEEEFKKHNNKKKMQTSGSQSEKTDMVVAVAGGAGAGVGNSGNMSFNMGDTTDEELSMSALSTFRAKEEEIERKKMEVRDRVQAQLGRVEQETKRLALIRGELESLANPMRKDVAQVCKRIDIIKKELKPLGTTVQKKEKEYKEALDAFNEKNKEKVQLINKLVELVGESERLRMKKLEELSKSIESLN
ncbi:hypothetical protein KSS87_010709 [Heliosperma pusillum]|nr:hypothetical protein KSS87_010709 [Heliosperma pusillum]